jgi:hypothetical protein
MLKNSRLLNFQKDYSVFKKPKTCLCGVGYRQRLTKWVVLCRSNKSLLKCLVCGWKWKSSCRYVDRLRDHKERHRFGLTDQDILDRLNAGTLVVSSSGGWVASVSDKGSVCFLSIRVREKRGSRYRFVSVCSKGKKKAIAVHRLVWIAGHRSLVPEGFDVHHKNSMNGDCLDNLCLLESGLNRSLGAMNARARQYH